jgi:type III secretion protein T
MAFDLAELVKLVEPLLVGTLRIATALRVAPLFPTTLFPSMLRNVVALSLSFAIYPHVAAHLPRLSLAPGDWMTLVAKEVLVGALIGLAVALLIHAFEAVGSIVDTQTGLSNGVLYDPFGGHAEGPMTVLFVRLAVAFFVVAGGLAAMASLLFESLRVWPIDAFHPSSRASRRR